MTLLQVGRFAGMRLAKDWRAHRYIIFFVLLLLLTMLVVLMYYLNHPGAEVQADSWSYLYVVDRIQTSGRLVNFWRLPGYPLFILLVYTLTGQGNLALVSETQAMLFVLATLELYVLAAIVFRRAWMACLVSLLVGTNVVLLSYIKPIMSEGLALFLLVSLALTVVWFVSTPGRTALWCVTGILCLLLMTRPEWIYLPPCLFVYLLLIARWRGMLRRLLPHALLSLALLASVLGSYFFVNATQSRFPGITWIQSINDLGKVLQYHMQNETSSQYTVIARTLDAYAAKGVLDPYPILSQQPALSAHYAALAGEYAGSIIDHHPGEFLTKSVPLLFSSLTVLYEGSSIASTGPFAPFLDRLQALFRALYQYNLWFPMCALGWLCLLCWRRTRVRLVVQEMGALALLSLYGLVSTTLGAYRGYDYMRIHVPFDPLIILVIGGTLLMGGVCLFRRMLKGTRRFFPGQYPEMKLKDAQKARSRLWHFTLVVIASAVILGSCGQRTARASAELVPILCHQENSRGMLVGTGVDLLYITVENQGQDDVPALLSVTFPTTSQKVPRVQLEKNIADIPAGAEIWVMVDLPLAPGMTSALEPAGKLLITITPVDGLPERRQAGRTLVTACYDAT